MAETAEEDFEEEFNNEVEEDVKEKVKKKVKEEEKEEVEVWSRRRKRRMKSIKQKNLPQTVSKPACTAE